MKLVRSKNRIAGEYDFQFSETVSDDQVDCTLIKYINEFWNKTNRDFNFAKSCIKELRDSAGGFDSLSEDEKEICVQWNLCTSEQALSTVGQQAYDLYADVVVEETRKARQRRVNAVRRRFGRDVTQGLMAYSDSNALLNDLEAMSERYIKGSNPEIIDWILGTGNYVSVTGQDYTGAGFMSKSYATAERQQYLIDYILEGRVFP